MDFGYRNIKFLLKNIIILKNYKNIIICIFIMKYFFCKIIFFFKLKIYFDKYKLYFLFCLDFCYINDKSFLMLLYII